MGNYSHTFRHVLAATVAAGFFLAAATSGGPAAAQDAPPSGFPRWSEVQAAKGDAAATAAQVATIGQLLGSLESEAGALGAAAVEAGAKLARTQSKLDASTVEVELLSAQAGRAADEAAKHRKDAVAVAVQNYKAGSTGVEFFASVAALESPESLNGAELMQMVGEQAARKQSAALEAQSSATALEKTRRGAQSALAALAQKVQAETDAAVAAQDAVAKQLAGKKEQSATLTAQLAMLNNTTAAKEAQYREGQEALAAYNEAQAAKRKAAEAAEAARAEDARRKAQEDAAPVPKPGKPAPNPAPKPGNPAPKPAPVDPDPDDGYIPVDVLLPNIPGGAVNDPAGAKAYASSRLGAYGWAQSEFSCLNQLWERESNWRTNATNPHSGAYGIAQSLPPGKYASAGADWLTNYRTQIEWGMGYIKNRYGSPCGAWGHSQSVGWY